MTSTTGSVTLSPKAVKRAAVVTHGQPQTIGPALARLATVAREAGVELVMGEQEAEKHGLDPNNGTGTDIDIAVVLGGDGTMLRALHRFLGPVPGDRRQLWPRRLSLLDSARRAGGGTGARLRRRVPRRGLPTLEVEVGNERRIAVNDLVVASAVVGRMIQLEWAVGGEGARPARLRRARLRDAARLDGLRLFERRAVLVWGLDAMSVTFVAPHSLNARPLVVPRGTELIVWNRTPDVPATALVDGHHVGELPPGGRAVARVGAQRSLLATLPEVTFFSRYRRAFAS